jgi:hypothetical protein
MIIRRIHWVHDALAWKMGCRFDSTPVVADAMNLDWFAAPPLTLWWLMRGFLLTPPYSILFSLPCQGLRDVV